MNEVHINNNLPFFDLSDDIFLDLLSDFQSNNTNIVDNIYLLNELNEVLFNQFTLDENSYSGDDPDVNYFNEFKDLINSTKYYLNTENDLMDGDVAGNSLSIYSHNVNSLSKHFQEIRTFLNGFKNKFDIVSFTETKLSDDIEQLYRLPNYNSFSLNNKRNSGGLMIYVNDNFEVTTRNDLTYKNDILECIFVEIKLSNSEHVVFGNMYRRPNTSIIDYLNILANILLTLKSESKKVIISGDININLLNCKNNGQIADYVNLFRSHNFLSLINKPTRVTNNSYTLIDHVWSNYYSNIIVGAIVYNQISDHFPTISIFNLTEVKQSADIY